MRVDTFGNMGASKRGGGVECVKEREREEGENMCVGWGEEKVCVKDYACWNISG